MTYTDNLNLNIIEEHDLIDYAVFNENANILDTEITVLKEAVESIPTLETSVTQNTTDITNLTTRVSTAETNITTQGQTINGIIAVNEQQSTDITANTTAINSAGVRISKLETLEGDLIKNTGGNYTRNPQVAKKLTVFGTVNYSPLTDPNATYLTVPAGELPTTFGEFFVNASIFNKGGDGQTRNSFKLNRAYLDSNGSLVIEFKTITDMIDPTGAYDELTQPQTNNLLSYAEIIFI